MPEDVDEIRLWQQIGREHDPNAFRQLFDRHYAALCRYAEFWLHDQTTAEEVVLDLFTHVWEHAGQITIFSSVKAYLFRAVRNRALNVRRSRRIEHIPLEEFTDIPGNFAQQPLEADEFARLVAEAIDALPDRCREVFLKSRHEELSNAEIARHMQLSVKTVEAHISKALRRLRQTLGRD